MVKFEGMKWKGFVLMTEDSLEHLLNCLDNQRALPVDSIQSESEQITQELIDDFSAQCRECLHSGMDTDDMTESPQSPNG